MKALVSIDWREHNLVVATHSQTSDGFWVMTGVRAVLDEGVDDNELGDVVLTAGLESQIGIPTPSVAELSRPSHAMVAVGAKTFREYVKGLRSVTVEFQSGNATITPHRNRGAKNGLIAMSELAITTGNLDALSIGVVVRVALVQAR